MYAHVYLCIKEDHALTCSSRHLTTVASSGMELLPMEEPMSATLKGPVLAERPDKMSLTAATSSCWAACKKPKNACETLPRLS